MTDKEQLTKELEEDMYDWATDETENDNSLDESMDKKQTTMPSIEIIDGNLFHVRMVDGVMIKKESKALEIRCEGPNKAKVKRILSKMNLDESLFGTFVRFGLTDEHVMYANAIDKQNEYNQEIAMIAIFGLDEEVLDTEVYCEEAMTEETIRDQLLSATIRSNGGSSTGKLVEIIKSINTTSKTASHGKWIIETTKTNKEEAAKLINKVLIGKGNTLLIQDRIKMKGGAFQYGIKRSSSSVATYTDDLRARLAAEGAVKERREEFYNRPRTTTVVHWGKGNSTIKNPYKKPSNGEFNWHTRRNGFPDNSDAGSATSSISANYHGYGYGQNMESVAGKSMTDSMAETIATTASLKEELTQVRKEMGALQMASEEKEKRQRLENELMRTNMEEKYRKEIKDRDELYQTREKEREARYQKEKAEMSERYNTQLQTTIMESLRQQDENMRKQFNTQMMMMRDFFQNSHIATNTTKQVTQVKSIKTGETSKHDTPETKKQKEDDRTEGGSNDVSMSEG